MSASALATQTPSTPTKAAQTLTGDTPRHSMSSAAPKPAGSTLTTPPLNKSKHHPPALDQLHLQRGAPSTSQLGVPGVSIAGHNPNPRLGTRSPASIPSSPTSIHSSSSAIFERDIEPVPSLSLGVPHSTNPHRIPRSKTTEALEATVPSVLDSAISALCSEDAAITVLSPAPVNVSTMSSSSGTSSGSPHVMALLLQGMGMSGLVSASASISGAASVSGFASGFASPIASSRAPSPTRSISPAGPPEQAISSSPPPSSVLSAGSPQKKHSIPPIVPEPRQQAPSPSMKAQNRLSFISYSDLLTNTPIAAQSLAAVLAPGPVEPPTHLVVLDHPTSAPISPTTSPLTPGTAVPGATFGVSSLAPAPAPIGIGSLNLHNGLPADKDVDVDTLGTVGLKGGEWEREGLGGGLEERLERLSFVEKELKAGHPLTPPIIRDRRPESMVFESTSV